MIHGLGATAAVWGPMIELAASHWAGRWIVLDLPGHGRSGRLKSYSIDDYVATLEPILRGADVLLGHSLGGVIAAALGPSVQPRAIFAMGVKVDWTAEELARMRDLSQRPPRIFPTQEDALSHHARLAGLPAQEDLSLLSGGLREIDGSWEAALDPCAFAIDPPDMSELVRASPCRIRLACGDRDPMVAVKRLQRIDAEAVSFENAGHNAMVEQPAAVWSWLSAASPTPLKEIVA